MSQTIFLYCFLLSFPIVDFTLEKFYIFCKVIFYPFTSYVKDEDIENFGYYDHKVYVQLEDGSTEDITEYFK